MSLMLMTKMMMIFHQVHCEFHSDEYLHDIDDDHLHDELDLDANLGQVNSVRINETRADSNKTNGEHSTESKISRKDSRSSNGDHLIDSKISRKDSKTSKDLPPVPPREREPPPVPSMESLISRRASSSRNEIYSKLRLLSLC